MTYIEVLVGIAIITVSFVLALGIANLLLNSTAPGGSSRREVALQG